jgi:hypothetical protein
MDLPLLKNDITKTLKPQKPVIYSRYMKSGLSAYTLEISAILKGKVQQPRLFAKTIEIIILKILSNNIKLHIHKKAKL